MASLRLHKEMQLLHCIRLIGYDVATYAFSWGKNASDVVRGQARKWALCPLPCLWEETADLRRHKQHCLMSWVPWSLRKPWGQGLGLQCQWHQVTSFSSCVSALNLNGRKLYAYICLLSWDSQHAYLGGCLFTYTFLLRHNSYTTKSSISIKCSSF